jgi:hypothetical protein
VITATVTGPGTLSAGSATGTSSGLKTVTYNHGAAGTAFVNLYGDGTAGSSSPTDTSNNNHQHQQKIVQHQHQSGPDKLCLRRKEL